MSETASAYPIREDDLVRWEDMLPAAESAGYRRITDQVLWALSDYVNEGDVRHVVEETLFQIARILRREGRITLPEIGTLELVSTASIVALVATPSPSLLEAVRHE